MCPSFSTTQQNRIDLSRASILVGRSRSSGSIIFEGNLTVDLVPTTDVIKRRQSLNIMLGMEKHPCVKWYAGKRSRFRLAVLQTNHQHGVFDSDSVRK